jgi:hypothetical protein
MDRSKEDKMSRKGFWIYLIMLVLIVVAGLWTVMQVETARRVRHWDQMARDYGYRDMAQYIEKHHLYGMTRAEELGVMENHHPGDRP